MSEFRRVSASFGKFRQVSASFGEFRRVSASFGEFRRVSVRFGEFWRVSESFSQFQRVSASLASFGKFLQASASFGDSQETSGASSSWQGAGQTGLRPRGDTIHARQRFQAPPLPHLLPPPGHLPTVNLHSGTAMGPPTAVMGATAHGMDITAAAMGTSASPTNMPPPPPPHMMAMGSTADATDMGVTVSGAGVDLAPGTPLRIPSAPTRHYGLVTPFDEAGNPMTPVIPTAPPANQPQTPWEDAPVEEVLAGILGTATSSTSTTSTSTMSTGVAMPDSLPAGMTGVTGVTVVYEDHVVPQTEGGSTGLAVSGLTSELLDELPAPTEHCPLPDSAHQEVPDGL